LVEDAALHHARAVVVLHGRLRNADVYYRSAMGAQAAAGDAGKATIMVVPQFLAEVDIERWHLPSDMLRWSLEGRGGGEPALGPIPVSSFDALDAILLRLADRNIFPNLMQVVVAGHSGGGQVVRRWRGHPDISAYWRALCRRQSLLLRLFRRGAAGAADRSVLPGLQ
jgi:hypothetical protein